MEGARSRNQRALVLSHLTVRAHPPDDSDPDEPDEEPTPADDETDDGVPGTAPDSLSVAGWSGVALLVTAVLLVLLGGALRRRRASA